jgi:hypothetical protein
LQALVLLKRIPESHTAFETAVGLAPDDKMYAKGLQQSSKRLDEFVPDLDPAHAAAEAATKTGGGGSGGGDGGGGGGRGDASSSASTGEPAPPPAKVAKTAASGDASTEPEAKTATAKPASEEAKPAAKPAAAPKDMRGYKVVNGKKTSYFHHEMTEEEKALIGDITPQRIDPEAQAAAVAPTVAVEGMSQWNSKVRAVRGGGGGGLPSSRSGSRSVAIVLGPE